MNALHTIRNYYFYCGIEKDEYIAVKKADIAMYQAKADPEHRFYIYEEGNVIK